MMDLPGDNLETDAEDEGPNFKGRILQISDDLHADDVESLKFICIDWASSSKLERISNPHELFSLCEKNFGKRYPQYVAELMFSIKRIDLLEDDLGVKEEDMEERIHNGDTMISTYRKMLLEVAEDMDSTELQKVLFLTGDMKKKEREKIKSPLTFFVYLEKTKTISPNDMKKIKEILKTIDRNDLVETIEEYEVSNCTAPQPDRTSKEELMDTRDSHMPREALVHDRKAKYAKIENPPQVNNTHCESTPEPAPHPYNHGNPGTSTANQIADQTANQMVSNQAVNQAAKQAGSRLQEMPLGARNEERHVEIEPPQSPTHPQPPPQNAGQRHTAISVARLREFARDISKELDETVWVVFANSLHVSVESSQQLGHQYSNMEERIFQLLSLWQHTYVGGHDSAVKNIITALHEVQVHHLAERFSMIYSSAGNTGMRETEDISLSSRTLGTNEHENISVHSGEARYQPEAHQQPKTEKTHTQSAETASTQTSLGAEAPVTDGMPHYRMNNFPRGVCLILNNEKFFGNRSEKGGQEMPDRQGSTVDADKLTNSFTQLGFQVMRRDNLSSANMMNACVDIALNMDHTNYDCLAVCILSHGVQGSVYGSDGRLVSINDLAHPFKPSMCQSLTGKPKLFFIQACQGREKQHGEIETDGPAERGLPKEVIPNEADFLIGYATVPGFVSYRSRTHGSWYITKLCDMLNLYGTRYDILSILLMVNYEVGRANAMIGEGCYKQAPAPLYTLRKKLQFKPPLFQ